MRTFRICFASIDRRHVTQAGIACISSFLLCMMLVFGGWAQPSAAPEGFPVTLGEQPLFNVKAKIGSFTPEIRAKVISERLQTYAESSLKEAPAIQAVDNPTTNSTDLVAGGQILMTLVEDDAIAADTSREELAQDYVQTMNQSIAEFRTSYSLDRILRGVGFAAIATVVLLISLLLINRLIPKIRATLRRWQGTKINGLSLFGNEILSADRLVDSIVEIIKLLRLILVLGLIFLYINLVLSFFPWTIRLSRQLFRYQLSAFQRLASGLFGYLPNLFVLLLTVIVTLYMLKIVRFVFTEIERGSMTVPGFYEEWARPTAKLTQFLILAFAAIVAFPYLPGSQSPAFQGVSIFLGLLVSLGSTGAIANVVSGTILTYTRSFKVGDRVKISDTIGDVVEKTLFVTRIKTIKNVVITIPNSEILSNHVINYSAAASNPEIPPLILSTTVTLGYDVPWTKVHQVLIEAALCTEQILAEPPPFVFQTSLDDYYVSYELNAYTHSPGIMAKIYSKLHQNIQDYCNQADIEILSPHYRAVRDGNLITIPVEYLSSNYQAPSFRIETVQPQSNSDSDISDVTDTQS